MGVHLVTFGSAVPLQFASGTSVGNDTFTLDVSTNPGCSVILQGGGISLSPEVLACRLKQSSLEQ